MVLEINGVPDLPMELAGPATVLKAGISSPLCGLLGVPRREVSGY